MTARDQTDRYCRWADEGYLSSTGVCFDICDARSFIREGNIIAIAKGEYLGKSEAKIRDSGYMVESLEGVIGDARYFSFVDDGQIEEYERKAAIPLGTVL